MLKLLRGVPLVVLAAVLLWPSTASALSCAPVTTPEQLRTADVAFLGTVTGKADGGVYTLRLDEPFKGELSDEVVVRDEFASTPGMISSGDMNLAVGQEALIAAQLKNGELVTNVCYSFFNPGEARALGASPGPAVKCKPGARTRLNPARRGSEDLAGERLITDKIVVGCGRTSILGKRFELDGYLYRARRTREIGLCVDTVLVASKSSYGGCGPLAESSRDVIDIRLRRQQGESPVAGIGGNVLPHVVAVAIRYSRDGVEYRRVATVVHPTKAVLKTLKLRGATGYYDAEVPVEATVLGVEARNANGRVVGSATAPPDDAS